MGTDPSDLATHVDRILERRCMTCDHTRNEHGSESCTVHGCYCDHYYDSPSGIEQALARRVREQEEELCALDTAGQQLAHKLRNALKGARHYKHQVERLKAHVLVVEADNARLSEKRDTTSEQLSAARKQVERCKAVLREVEWEGIGHAHDDIVSACVCCSGLREVGHAPDCRLAAALKGEE